MNKIIRFLLLSGCFGIFLNSAAIAAQCNDGIDNDGDGLIDWQFDLGCTDQADTTEGGLISGSIEDGWSVMEPATDTIIYYVSNSDGNDSNNGLSPNTALKTYAAAFAKTSENAADWILLKRGDTFTENVSVRLGRSAIEPFVVSSYGDSTQRPLMKTGAQIAIQRIASFQFFSIIGLDFYAHTRDPNSAEFVDHEGDDAIDLFRRAGQPGNNVLIENCAFRYYEDSTVSGAARPVDIHIRRNIFEHNYSSDGSHSQGIGAGLIDNLVFEDNIMDHNGWLIQSDGSSSVGQATIFNHNTYFLGMNNMLYRGNALMRGSSLGSKFTSTEQDGAEDFVIDDNLYLDNEVGISMGFNFEDVAPHRFNNIAITNNVLLDFGNSQPTARTLGWGMWLDGLNGGDIRNNHFLHNTSQTVNNTFALYLDGPSRNVSVSDNIIHGINGSGSGHNLFNLGNNSEKQNIDVQSNRIDASEFGSLLIRSGEASTSNFTFADNNYYSSRTADEWFELGGTDRDFPSWVGQTGETGGSNTQTGFCEPTRNIESYQASLGYTASMDSFITEIKQQGKFHWRNEYDVTTVNAWIRAGFADCTNLDPDEDEVVGVADNCPAVANADQADKDQDGRGDVCDLDLDGDGFNNDVDNCPVDFNDQADADNDGIGDRCDSDWIGNAPIAGFGDEFSDASSIVNWKRIFQEEGWGANQLEDWSVNNNSSGEMHLTPYSSSWFADLRGVLAFKEITGDFIATAKITVNSRHNSADASEPPNRRFSLAGIMVRNATGFSHGAPDITFPNPDVEPATTVFDPGNSGNSDWRPNSENYIFLSYGAAGNAGQRAYEVKSTVNGSSSLYYSNRGVPTENVAEGGPETVWLQFIRIGQTVVVMRRHPGGNWVVENRYTRADFADTLQIGITTYTDWDRVSRYNNEAGSFFHNYSVIDFDSPSPDLIARVDYLRFLRPDAAWSEALLTALEVDEPNRDTSTTSQPLSLLEGTPVAPYLGENANTPVNLPPIVDAGDNQSIDESINESINVKLTGNATDSDGTIASYAWTQTSGTSVSLSSPDTAVASFIAPEVTADETLVFQFLVTDDAGATATDTVNVNINNIPTATIFPNGGSFNSRVGILLSSDEADAVLYYTLDGSTPTIASTQYTDPILLSQSATLKTMAVKNVDSTKIVVSADFSLNAGNIWQPAPATSWQWQLTGEIDTSIDVAMYDIDLFNTSQATIDQLHADGRKVVCYLSAGSYENFRSDAGDFPASLLGNTLDGFADEQWLDIRQIDLLAPIMRARLDLAVTKGCDGVEPDNMDGYLTDNNAGFPLSSDDQTRYNLWIANEAHARGLSVGLKNDLEQIPLLEPFFDWALNEQCYEFDECNTLAPFTTANKAVFGVEYQGDPVEFCPVLQDLNYSWMLKGIDLDATRTDCRDLVDFTWDIDGDGTAKPLTDGLILLRYQFGFRGDTLISQSIDMDATRTTAADIEAYIAKSLLVTDIDGDGTSQALTDGLLLLRYLFGFRGEPLINDAIDVSATRLTADEIEEYISARLQ